MDKFNIIYEKTMSAIPDAIQKQLGRISVRKSMPNDAFLLPSEKKFPIKRPGSKEIDPQLVYAAYVRAKQWSKKKPEYEKIATQAKDLFIKIKGPSKLNIKLEASLYEDDDTDLKQVVSLLNNINSLDSTPKDQSNDPEHCICPKCDYQSHLNIEDTVCELKSCPKCNTKMMDSVFTKDRSVSESLKTIPDIKDKMRFLMENNTSKKSSDRKICNTCQIIITEEACQYQKNICPGCGKEFQEVTTSITLESGRHFSCPKCNTIKPYTKINEDNCPVCTSLMTVFDIPIIKKTKGLPIIN